MTRRVNPSRLGRRWCALLDRERADADVRLGEEGAEFVSGYQAGLCMAQAVIRKG
jgi:hypothetical protein